MKKFITLIILGVAFLSCAQNHNKKKPNIDMKSLPNYPKEKQITYAIHINAKTPYEIFIDDIPLERFYESGISSTMELNPYLLGNGKHELRVRYLPLESAKDSLLHPGDVYFNKDAKWNIFFVSYIKNDNVPLGYEGEIDYVNNELKVLPPPKPVPFWEQTFSLDIKDLPYSIKGWSASKNLNELDRDILEDQVFDFFRKLRNTMDNGDFDTFLRMNEIKDKETTIFTYDKDLNWSIAPERKDEFLGDCKGNMWPVSEDQYFVKVYGNGRLATIERKFKLKKQCLIAETEESYFNYNFLIHKPKSSDSFEIIRK